MALLTTNGLYRDFGGEVVLQSVDLSLEAGRKYGLVGRNGCGKTTLVRILAGLDDDFRGSYSREPGLRLAYVDQKLDDFFEGESCVDYLIRDVQALAASLDEQAEAMGSEDQATARQAMRAYSEQRERYDAMDGDFAAENAERLLQRIGLGERAWVSAQALSGGEKNLLALAKALLTRPDLLILDEPGNHLDLAGLTWLEDYLAGLPCAILMVSHDRRLLDRVVDTILELEQGRVSEWRGNYSQYRLERLRKAAAQGRSWQADQRRVERLEALVRRFAEIARSRPDPAWGKRLRARRSQLERVRSEATDRPDLGNLEARVAFDSQQSKADLALAVSGYSKAYDQAELLCDTGFTILNGERVALVGPNGCGKTSFLRDLVRDADWNDRCLRMGPSMVRGYCSQQPEVFEAGAVVEDAFLKILADRQEVLQHLGRFLFTYQDLGRRIDSLSGGELNRLQLARASALKANFLILDEPTNHLDIPTREAVEEALNDFDGTVLVVSHDRYFLDKITDRVVFIQDKAFVEYEGSFSEYWRDIGRQATGSRSQERRGQAIDGREAGARKRQAAASGGKGDLEARITAMERQKESMEKQIAAAVGQRSFARAKDLSMELERHNKLLEQAWRQLD